MTTKEKVRDLFEENRGVYFSGEEMAQRLSISRAAVWKAVNALKKEGYVIHAVTNKGYCLSGQTDVLSAQGIRKYLSLGIADMEISVFPAVSSTNTVMREKALEGAADRYLILSNEQTAGRGRSGRNFYSPGDTGVYLSILLRPGEYLSGHAVNITTMAAVAMCEAIESVSGEKAEIKWVNDIFVRGKKVCGILTEGSFSLENGMLEYAILGIGMNLYDPKDGFPGELEGIAGTIFQTRQDDGKNRLVAEFLNRFYACYQSPLPWDYVKKYRERSMVIGRQITIGIGEEIKRGRALAIDDQCRLLVEYEDGRQECYSSGEVSISWDREKR